jgi:hypothetical protein
VAGGRGEVLDDATIDPGEVGQEHGQEGSGGEHRARGEKRFESSGARHPLNNLSSF